MVDKKVDNPENKSWVNVKFQKFACHEVWLYSIKAEEKLCKRVSVASSVLLLCLSAKWYGSKLMYLFLIKTKYMYSRLYSSTNTVIGYSISVMLWRGHMHQVKVHTDCLVASLLVNSASHTELCILLVMHHFNHLNVHVFSTLIFVCFVSCNLVT